MVIPLLLNFIRLSGLRGGYVVVHEIFDVIQLPVGVDSLDEEEPVDRSRSFFSSSMNRSLFYRWWRACPESGRAAVRWPPGVCMWACRL
jgi:hypothetical protein